MDVAPLTSWILLLVCLFSPPSLQTADPLCLQTPTFPKDFMHLTKQDKALIRDLKLINYPPQAWKIEPNPTQSQLYYDVVIIGGGMAGLTAGAALFKEGIFNIKIFDQNPPGYEGPWITYARMKTLRSTKELMGPALDIPHLTFHAWFEAQWGQEAWKQIDKIPNDLWMDYLKWFRQALQLPVENHCQLIAIIPMQDCLELEFQQASHPSFVVKARKVVLATGRGGCGGLHIPDIVKHLPKSFYAHTAEPINFTLLKDRRIGIIGVGASAFDAAAVALENGAKTVDLIMRRDSLPTINKFVSLPYKGFSLGYYQLSDEKRWEFMKVAFEAGIPPPLDVLKRLQGHQNFYLQAGTTLSRIDVEENELHIQTNKGQFVYDFLILGTGFHINGDQPPELSHIGAQIALWQDRLPAEIVNSSPHFGKFPYLGPSFEYLPKEPGTAPYLKRLYCFNYGATLSHGLLSSDIPGVSLGATRLAQGIASDFFIQDSDYYLESLKNYQEPDFKQSDYFP